MHESIDGWLCPGHESAGGARSAGCLQGRSRQPAGLHAFKPRDSHSEGTGCSPARGSANPHHARGRLKGRAERGRKGGRKVRTCRQPHVQPGSGRDDAQRHVRRPRCGCELGIRPVTLSTGTSARRCLIKYPRNAKTINDVSDSSVIPVAQPRSDPFSTLHPRAASQ